MFLTYSGEIKVTVKRARLASASSKVWITNTQIKTEMESGNAS